ncbi:MAG: IPT/TIG domain-containing protein [Myxococcota bacterium]
MSTPTNDWDLVSTTTADYVTTLLQNLQSSGQLPTDISIEVGAPIGTVTMTLGAPTTSVDNSTNYSLVFTVPLDGSADIGTFSGTATVGVDPSQMAAAVVLQPSYLALDGDDAQYVQADANGGISSTACTFEAWINTTTTDAQTICMFGSDGTPAVSISGNRLTLSWGDTYTSADTTDVSDGRWHHVAIVVDDGSITVYKDGQAKGTIAMSDDQSSGSDFYLAMAGDDTAAFDGQLTGVRVWTVARTAEEIQQNMNVAVSGDESGLIQLWTFADGSATNECTGDDGTVQGDPSITVLDEDIPYTVYFYCLDPSAAFEVTSELDPDSIESTFNSYFQDELEDKVSAAIVAGNGTDSDGSASVYLPTLIRFVTLAGDSGEGTEDQLLSAMMTSNQAAPDDDLADAFGSDADLEIPSGSNTVLALWDYWLFSSLIVPKMADTLDVSTSDFEVSQDPAKASLTEDISVKMATIDALTLQFEDDGLQLSMSGSAICYLFSASATLDISVVPGAYPDEQIVGNMQNISIDVSVDWTSPIVIGIGSVVAAIALCCPPFGPWFAAIMTAALAATNAVLTDKIESFIKDEFDDIDFVVDHDGSSLYLNQIVYDQGIQIQGTLSDELGLDDDGGDDDGGGNDARRSRVASPDDDSTDPSISDFSPTSGGAGTQVTLTGSGLLAVTELDFNGTPASKFRASSDTTMTATVADGTTSGPIHITSASSDYTTDDDFTIADAPVITSFDPTSGAEGDEITITGTGLSTVTEASFGSIAADVQVDSDTELVATVPAGATNAPIWVSGPGGSEQSPTSFTVTSTVAPQVDGFDPATGSAGTMVTVTGSGFTGTTSVSFGGVVASSFAVSLDTQLVAFVASGSPSGPVAVTNTEDTDTSSDDFEILAPPSIDGFSPSSGEPGDSVTISGSDLADPTSVTFGANRTAVEVSSSSDSEIVAVVPSGMTDGTIQVTTAGGSVPSDDSFSVLSVAAPTIDGFDPTEGGVGTNVTLSGSNFTGATAVDFGGVQAVGFNVVSDSEITVLVPAQAVDGEIGVENTEGYIQSDSTFEVVALPYITNFSPTTGSEGDSVTLTGTGLDGATVHFGNSSVEAEIDSSSDTELVVLVPSGAGSGVLTAQTSGGTTPSGGSFTVISAAAPVVSSVSPTSGPAGTEVELQGSDFTGVTGVSFGGVDATAFTIDSDTQLQVTVPVSAQTGSITVTNSVDETSSDDTFTVDAAPSLDSFSPESGAMGDVVTLSGSGLSTTRSVRFGSQSASWEVLSDSQVQCWVPSGATSAPITVTNTDNAPAVSDDDFTVTAADAPAVTSISPDNGGVGTLVTVSGSGFTGVTGVDFDGTDASFTVASDSQLTTFVPSDADSGPINVTNSVGSDSSSDFTVVPPPSIDDFSPGSGEAGTSVTVEGSNLSGTTQVTLGGGGTPAEFEVVDDGELTVTVPSGAVDGPIAVKTPGGGMMSDDDFSVDSSASPTIDGFSPASGGVGTQVTIAGSNFTGTTSVTFNETTTSFTVTSDAQLSVRVPDGATTGPITVTNTEDTADSSDDFEVAAAPVVTGFNPPEGYAGDSVTLTGSNFDGTLVVQFNGTGALFTVTDSTSISTTVPEGATNGPISVTTAGGTDPSPSDFTVDSSEAPTIDSFTPTSDAPGQRVTVTGSGFTGATKVKFNGTNAAFTTQSDTRLVATVPDDATTGEITVKNSVDSVNSSEDFTVEDEDIAFVRQQPLGTRS